MTKNIWPVMPIMMLGSSIASILTIMFNVHDPAPHGGFLVLPVVENGPLWVLAILIGAVVGGILFVAFKKYDFEKSQKPLLTLPLSRSRPPRPLPSRLPSRGCRFREGRERFCRRELRFS